MSAWLTVDGGCIIQGVRETGWGLMREIRNSIWGKFEMTVEHEGKVFS